MRPRKWVKTTSKVLLFIGLFIAIGTAGNCDAYPDYPAEKAIIQASISLLFIVQNFFICKEWYK
jgi:hypothetical protein